MQYKSAIITIILVSIITQVGLTQETTGLDVVQTALDATGVNCDALSRDQACYGHTQLSANAVPGADSAAFESEGDRINLSALQSLKLSGMNVETGDWGVAMMQVRASLPAAGLENVTLLAFGDVQLDNAVLPPTGSDESVSDQNVADRNAPPLEPMQAFYFQSGADAGVFNGVPASGLLIQTPEGVGEVQLLINEINFQIGSTVFFEAQPGGQMTVSTLEGRARVIVNGVESIAWAGTTVTVPLNNDLTPAGPPSMPVPYDETAIHLLPVSILAQAIEVASPLSSSAIEELTSPTVSIVIEGPVQAVTTDTITIFDIDIQVDSDDPILLDIEIGDNIRVEGATTTEDDTITIIAVNITIIDVIIIAPSDSDSISANDETSSRDSESSGRDSKSSSSDDDKGSD